MAAPPAQRFGAWQARTVDEPKPKRKPRKAKAKAKA
jgi:hypothetical protein